MGKYGKYGRYGKRNGVGRGETAKGKHPKDGSRIGSRPQGTETHETDAGLRQPGIRHIIIGFEDDHATDAARTRQQIARLMACECSLVTAAGEPMKWADLYNPDLPETRLGHIVEDRRIRKDEGAFMADRPPFAYATIEQGRCVRLEFYRGHDALALTLDLRSAGLQDQYLQPFMNEDPLAYDPIAYLKEVMAAKGDVAVACRNYWAKRGWGEDEEAAAQAQADADQSFSQVKEKATTAKDEWAEVFGGLPDGLPQEAFFLQLMESLLRAAHAPEQTAVCEPQDGPNGPDPERWWQALWGGDNRDRANLPNSPNGPDRDRWWRAFMDAGRTVPLLTPDDLQMLPDSAEFDAQYARAAANDIAVTVHYFHSLAGWDWYPLWAEWNEELGDVLFYGYVTGAANEFGTFTLEWLRYGFCESTRCRGTIVERDAAWGHTDHTLADVLRQ